MSPECDGIFDYEWIVMGDNKWIMNDNGEFQSPSGFINVRI